jgi:hypothetical protein
MENEGVLDNLEEVQMHKNHLVFEKAASILQTFFVPEGQDDDDLLATI